MSDSQFCGPHRDIAVTNMTKIVGSTTPVKSANQPLARPAQNRKQKPLMDFDIYQIATKSTAIYPSDFRTAVVYTSLGLASEAGEVAGKVKKAIRDEDGVFSQDRIEMISEEIGDVLWYCARLADELGLDLNDIARMNLDKLNLRKAVGKLGGDGDRR